MPKAWRKQPRREVARSSGPDTLQCACVLTNTHTHTPRHRAEPKNKPRTKWGSGTEIAVVTMAVTFAAALPFRHIKQPAVRMAEAPTGD